MYEPGTCGQSRAKFSSALRVWRRSSSLVEVQLFDEKAIAGDVERKRKAAAPIDEYLQTLKQEAAQAIRQAEDVHKRLSQELHKRLDAART